MLPLKINMEHNHGGGEDDLPFFSWVICRFQPFIFQGVSLHLSWMFDLFGLTQLCQFIAIKNPR